MLWDQDIIQMQNITEDSVSYVTSITNLARIFKAS